MAFFRGPNIVKEGLILMLDAANPKSFKGITTTNLVPDPLNMSSANWQTGNAPSQIVVTGNQIDPFGTNNAIRFTVASDGGLYPHIKTSLVGVISGTTASHTISIYAKSISGSTNFDIVCFRLNPWAGAFSKRCTLTTEWQRFEVTGVPLDTSDHRVYFMGQNVGSSIATDYLLAYPQVEQQSYATPFVNGSRIGTFYDLSGNDNHHVLEGSPLYQNNSLVLNGANGFSKYSAMSGATANNTVVLFYSTSDTQELWVIGNYTGYTYLSASSGNNYYHGACGSPTNYVDTKLVLNPTEYRNNKYHMWEAKNVDFTTWSVYQWFLYGGEWNMIGNIALVAIYNRALSAQESEQNFNALKGRFGL